MDRIEPAGRYWAIDGEPTLLIGASSEDNLFQIPTLAAELDTLVAAGGNYVRNTLSSREDFAVWPFALTDDESYDLESWNRTYWDRLERFLRLTDALDIVPQFELWAFHDIAPQDQWVENPWNPANTSSYDATDVSLTESVGGDYHGGELHPFFLTHPDANDDTVVRDHQERFVDRVLETIAPFDHVLICITNEIFSQYPASWSRYWVEYVHERTDAPVTEMFQETDLTHEQHREAFDDPGRYDFLDTSQNAGVTGDRHWDNLQWVREYIEDHPRPINHVKTYGGETVWTDGPEHGVRRFWRNLIGGGASTRFHRPPAGIGLSDRAQRHVASARALADRFPFHRATIDADHALLRERDPEEAYLAFVPDEAYAVYFPAGGTVTLDVTDAAGDFALEWLHLEGAEWITRDPDVSDDGTSVKLRAPGGGQWVALLSAA